MAAKRRNPKRRLTPDAELEAWEMVFASGWDFFDDVGRLGVPMEDHRPDRAAAEDAWNRLGARFLAAKADPVGGTPWALAEFGEPHAG